MRRTKSIIWWSLGLLLLLVVVLAVFLATAGDGFYRWAARQLLEDKLGRPIQVDGTFSFDVGWEPTLAVTDVWIENATWAEKREMARVKRAEVQFALKPLFSGIVLVPRLVVEGLTLDLETGPDGEGNWEVGKGIRGGGRMAGQEDLFFPLFEFISLKDVAITYRDRRSGRDTEILLQRLEQKQLAQYANLTIQGEGSVNQTAFRIEGRFGSIEDALAAAAPYPLKLTLETSGFVADLTGTAKNLPRAEGLDISITARTSSIARVLKNLGTDLTLAGHAKASARLTGNLDSLNVEDLVFEVVERSRQVLHVEGSLSNLLAGKGLNLRFKGKLGPEARRLLRDPPPELRNILNDITGLDVAGRITGDLKAPAFDKLHVLMKHRSGADLSLQGHLALDLAGNSKALTGLGVTSTLSLPDAAILEQALKKKLPSLSALSATAELSLADGWIILSSLGMETKSLEELQIKANGRIGKLSGNKFDFKLDPQLNLSASMYKSRPLTSLFDETLPELGPVMASVRLSRTNRGYRLDDAQLTLGAKDSFWIEASGTLGAVRPKRDDPLDGPALTVSFAIPSSKALPRVFPPEMLELKGVNGRFDVRGSPKALSISKARIEAEGPEGLVWTATGQVAELSLSPNFASKD
ncbi:MAG: AsmA family protein, partial [Candidatus Binatia bacterium]